MIKVKVTAASRFDNQELWSLVQSGRLKTQRLQKIWVDKGYQDNYIALLARYHYELDIEVVSRPAGAKGWMLLPRRWVVERTFAWLGRFRRLSKDYEWLTKTSEAMIYSCMSTLMLRRLAKQTA
jgi:putative transposase